MEIDARFDLHAAACHAQIDRKRSAEFQRCFDLADSFGSQADRKNPPPPSNETVRLNGRCRSQKLKRTSAGFESNGSANPAPSETCSSAKIPTATDGILIE